MDPVDTGRKLDVHETSRRLLNVLCTFNLRPVSTGENLCKGNQQSERRRERATT